MVIYYSLYQELHCLPEQGTKLGTCKGAVYSVLMQNRQKKASHIKVQDFIKREMSEVKCFALGRYKCLLEYVAAPIML